MSTSVSSSFELLSQQALCKEIQNGKCSYVSLKGHQLILVLSSTEDLRNFTVEPLLIFDTFDLTTPSNEPKIQPVVNSQMQHKIYINQTGLRATIEIKLFSLSSKYQNRYFRVMVSITNSGKLCARLFSDPIRVVSKRYSPSTSSSLARKKPRLLGDSLAPDDDYQSPENVESAPEQKSETLESQLTQLGFIYGQFNAMDRAKKIQESLEKIPQDAKQKFLDLCNQVVNQTLPELNFED